MKSTETNVKNVPEIKKLEENVINKIAAGEVVQKPSAAIKEMLENSIDAGSTCVSIIVKSGGLDFLQIQDNGHGIRKEDLPILCERFTTSKLKTFNDLSTISTFGFRGEALASISYVSHVTVTTKTNKSPVAFKAKYCDGKLMPLVAVTKSIDPKPCAGVQGTIITVENLFYNLPSRRQAYAANNTENYQSILDVATRYAIHYGNRNISFTCKRTGTSSSTGSSSSSGHNSALVSNNGSSNILNNSADLYTPNHSNILNNIQIAYGSNISSQLLFYEYNNQLCIDSNNNTNNNNPNTSTNATTNTHNSDDNDIVNNNNNKNDTNLDFSSTTNNDNYDNDEHDNNCIQNNNQNTNTLNIQINGYISSPNYTSKKLILILFINNRLVESSNIKKIIDAVYYDILPRHTHPFIYLSLTLPSHHVDVNVHPTKKEVHFLNEDEILKKLFISLKKRLMSENQSRNLMNSQSINITHINDLMKSTASSTVTDTITTTVTTTNNNRNNYDNTTINNITSNLESTTTTTANTTVTVDLAQSINSTGTVTVNDSTTNNFNDINENENHMYINDDNDAENINNYINNNNNNNDDNNINTNQTLSNIIKSYNYKSKSSYTNTTTNTNKRTNNSAAHSNNVTPAYKYIRTDSSIEKIQTFFKPVNNNNNIHNNNGNTNSNSTNTDSTTDMNVINNNNTEQNMVYHIDANNTNNINSQTTNSDNNDTNNNETIINNHTNNTSNNNDDLHNNDINNMFTNCPCCPINTDITNTTNRKSFLPLSLLAKSNTKNNAKNVNNMVEDNNNDDDRLTDDMNMINNIELITKNITNTTNTNTNTNNNNNVSDMTNQRFRQQLQLLSNSNNHTPLYNNNNNKNYNNSNGNSNTSQSQSHSNDINMNTNNDNNINDINSTFSSITIMNNCIHELISSIYTNKHIGLQHILKHHSFIGFLDDSSCLIQYQTKIILMNYYVCLEQLFQQMVVRQLGHLSVFILPNCEEFIYNNNHNKRNNNIINNNIANDNNDDRNYVNLNSNDSNNNNDNISNNNNNIYNDNNNDIKYPNTSYVQLQSQHGISITQSILSVLQPTSIMSDNINHQSVNNTNIYDINININIKKSKCIKLINALLEKSNFLLKYFQIGIGYIHINNTQSNTNTNNNNIDSNNINISNTNIDSKSDCNSGIIDAHLYCLPEILHGYFPDQNYVSLFLYRLSIVCYKYKHLSIFFVNNDISNITIDNTNEQSESDIYIQSVLQAFIMDITKELSYFYSYLPVETIPKDVNSSTVTSTSTSTGTSSAINIENNNNNNHTKDTMTNISNILQLTSQSKYVFESFLYPSIKRILIPNKTLLELKVDQQQNKDINEIQIAAFIPITSLEKLYRVFERC